MGATVVEESQPDLDLPEATVLAAAAAATAASDATTVEPELTTQEALPEAPATAAVSTPTPATPTPQAPPPPAEPEASGGLPIIGNIKPLYLAIGGGVIVLIIIGIIFGGSLFSGGDDGGVPVAGASQTENPDEVILVETEAPTDSPTETETLAPPTEIPTPTIVPTVTQTPTETVPPGIPFTRITDISIDEQDRYEIAYETFEFTEEISSTTLHVHFFFDTVPPENAGVPGSGPWILYGGPRPFTGYRPADRPAESTQMCILVANPDHSIQMDSGNCFNLPDVNPPTTTIIDDSGASMGFVPGGPFEMGSNEGDVTNQPIHPVSVEDYYIDQYEVTIDQYAACVDAGACNSPSDPRSLNRDEYYGYPGFENYPVVNVTWLEATAFCEWRGARLPTEAEWDKAARSTDLRTHPWGEDPMTCEMANVNNCQPDTNAVGSFPRDVSPYGIFDLAGNIREMTADWYNTYPGGDPAGNPYYGETHRTTRGGTFDTNWQVDSRGFVAPEDAFPQIGFRCASSP
jgi:formylglycine-generating enzyme required for sulfatase activity